MCACQLPHMLVISHSVMSCCSKALCTHSCCFCSGVDGWDATGVFGVTKPGNIEIKKQAAAAGHFVTTPQYKKFSDRIFQEYQMVVGHNRKATHGEKKHADAHPFWDKEEKICLVHNGMISNHKEFDAQATVDSAAIANALATDTIDDVISKISGAFAFIWYNIEEKKLYLIRNAMRPLYVLETATTLLLASEDSLAYWIAKRNGATIQQCQDLTPMTLYSIDLKDRKLIEERKIEKKTYTTITTTQQAVIVNQTLEDAPETYFLTTNDLNTPQKVAARLHKGDRIQFMVDSYETIGTNAYTVMCKMINVDNKDLDVRMYMNYLQFNAADLTGVFSGVISSFLTKGAQTIVYVHDIDEQKHLETKNGYIVTDAMWFDDRFPSECDICKTRGSWLGVEKSEIIIDNLEVLLVCPKCTGTHKHV